MPEKNPIPVNPRGSRPLASSWVVLGFLFLSPPVACVAPPFRGYQIQDPPEGFLYDDDSSAAQVVFPDREMLSHGAWWRMSPDDHYASIFITRFRGAAGVEDVEAARDRYESALAQSGGGDVTQLQFLRIDGREAWGWEEHRRNRGELAAVAYRAVVLYDTMAIALEFYSDMPALMDPAVQKAALASFGYGKTRVRWGPLVLLVLLGGVLVVGFLRHLARRAAGPLTATDYELPSIDRGHPGEEEGEDPGR